MQEDRVLGSGAHWILPYPIHEMVKIPAETKVSLDVDTFWYRETARDIIGQGPKPRQYVPRTLDPLVDGYCLTRSEPGTSAAERSRFVFDVNDVDVEPRPGGMRLELSGSIVALGPVIQANVEQGSDYNIVHSKWQITYQIGNVEQFFRNVYVPDVKPGQLYYDVMTEAVAPLLRSVLEDAVCDTTVHYSVDEAIRSKDQITIDVKARAQKKLEDLQSGIKVVSVYMTDVIWPRQVDNAFQDFLVASQKSREAISAARTYATTTLSRAAGPVAQHLYAALHDPNVTQDRLEYLWSQSAGTARDEISEADKYRSLVVENARASAERLESLLPEYRKRPDLVLRRLYLDAVEPVFADAEEVFIIQPTKGTKGTEIRVLVSRDPAIGRKSEADQAPQGQEEQTSN